MIWPKLNEKLLNLHFGLPVTLRNLSINLYGFYQARQRFGKCFGKYLKDLNESQYHSPEKLKDLQIESLKKIVNHAYNTTEYYHKIFIDYGINPKDIQTFDDLKKIPVITRKAIRRNFNALLSENFPRHKRLLHSSSGTTGEKLLFYLPKNLRWIINYAHLYRFYGWANFKPCDKHVTIGGRLFTKRRPYWAFNKFENQLLLSIHHLNDKTVDDYLRVIKDFSPLAIQGHPSGINFLAERLIRQERKIPIKAIFTTGETIFESQRKTIEEAFMTKVFDNYGMGEAVVMALECEQHRGYHESSEYGILEVINVNNNVGEIVGTSLHNFAMPFIRYKVGDLAEIAEEESCVCNKELPLKISRIIGRIDDKLILKDGKVVLPVTVRMILKRLLGEEENYQLIQETINDFYFKISSKKLGNSRKNTLKNILKQSLLGCETNIYIEEVEEIPLMKGKLRNVISHVREC